MKVLIRLFTFLTFLAWGSSSWAAFFAQESFNYISDNDSSSQKLQYTNMKSVTFLGAEFMKSRKAIIGVDFYYWTRTAKEDYSGKDSSLTMLEMGPRIQYFFDEPKTFYVSFAYHMYAKGDRKIYVSSTEETQTVDGSGMFASMGYQLKFNRAFYAGLSLNYHSLSLASKVVGTTETKISDSYTSIFPMVEFSLRFR